MQAKESKTNWHFWISIVKSGFRIGACFFLFQGDVKTTAILLGSAEVLGIAEELF
jgi:hypothetical protein